MISLIAAIDSRRGIGKDNQLLWKIPEDMKRFRTVTAGRPVIMGRRTFDSIGRPLPGRTNIIVTRDTGYRVDGCTVVHSLDEAFSAANGDGQGELFVIGGAQIYEQALPHAHKLYLTLVDGVFDADTFFPPYPQFTKEVFREKGQGNGFTYTFVELEKP